MLPQKIFKFGASEYHLLHSLQDIFSKITTKENAVISCLFYQSISSVIGKLRTLGQKMVKQ